MLTELLNLERPLIIFDLETTGKDPATARICSLGMRIHKPEASPENYKSLVNPGVMMPRDAEEAHGISDAILLDGCAKCWNVADVHPHVGCPEWKPIPKFPDLAERLFTGFANADFSGYNVRYDLRVMTEEFARCGFTFDYSQAAIIDPLRLWQLLEPRTLSDAVEYFAKRKLVGAHDALTDVLGTEEALIGQLTDHPRSSMLPRDVRKLHELSWPRIPGQIDSEGKFKFVNGVVCFNFGKWNNEPVKQHLDYVRWMYGGNFSPEVKRLCDSMLSGRYPEETTNEG